MTTVLITDQYKLPAHRYQRECAICGQPILPGQKQNKEHIVSDWALRWTDSARHVQEIYWDYQKGEYGKMPYGGFKFPVHEACNSVWSRLIEAPAAAAFKHCSAGESLTNAQLLAIMVWADKTRAMMEFAVGVLSKNPFRLQRAHPPMGKVGMTDRVMILYRYPGWTKPYIFSPSLPAFAMTPTTLHIRIRDIGLVFCTDMDLFENYPRILTYPRVSKVPVVDTLLVAQKIDYPTRLMMRGFATDPEAFLVPYGHGRLLALRSEPPNVQTRSRSPHKVPRVTTDQYRQLNLAMDLDALRFLRLTQAAFIERHIKKGQLPDRNLVEAHAQLKVFEQELVDEIEAFEMPPGSIFVDPDDIAFRP